MTYRRLTVKTVKEKCGSLSINFEGSIIELSIKHHLLPRYGIMDIKPGDHLFVSGRTGNEDVDLWGFDTFADIRKEAKEI